MTRKKFLLVACLVVLAGCSGAAIPERQTTATVATTTTPTTTIQTATTTAEPVSLSFSDAQLNYSIEATCLDHEATNGEYIQECHAELQVHTMSGPVQSVKFKVVSDEGYQNTETVTKSDIGPLWEATTGELPENATEDHLKYGDKVVVSAVLTNGTEVVVETHEFSCEDVYYWNACKQTTTTETAETTTEKATFDSMGATAADAQKLERNLSRIAPVDVMKIAGSYSVMWAADSPNVTVPNATKKFADMNQTQTELALLIFDYYQLAENGTIEGSMTLTAVHRNDRFAIWTVKEQWVDATKNGKMTVGEFFDKIRATRVDLPE